MLGVELIDRIINGKVDADHYRYHPDPVVVPAKGGYQTSCDSAHCHSHGHVIALDRQSD
ncbi:hypothetical protein CPTB_01329 [Corynebacterium pseudotuberculosis]|nr:Hypothetical protein Cp3995_1869 [Corynebacterium pseudotuberculosis 3/99-5]AIG06029.1 hypothetical protein CPTA_00200 [Corynebacterium pseudotuberculosis]AIG09385.1 hypothetical protein CPTB_01329 [Corynebacterium pseudotuberculosis]AQL51927.1 hypothetical protein CpPA04_1841 [Corynebacterium pseudotuberculosis]